MKSGKATAKLTVNKADGSCTISISKSIDYGSKPNPAASSTTNSGEPKYFYKLSSASDEAYSSNVPTEPGEYCVKAVFSATDLYGECKAEAAFTITKNILSIKTKNKSVVYDGNAIDITSLFEIGKDAGEATYRLEETSNATLAEGLLTVTSAGTYSITVETEETATMKSGKATAKLIVNKAGGNCTVSISDIEYGSKPNPAASSTTNSGEPKYFYKLSSASDEAYSSNVPTEPGEYKVKAVFTATNLYTECSAEAPFTIIRTQGTLSITATDKTVVYDGNAIDITSLFEIGEGAGEATYSLEETSNATLENGKLTVTSSGTYTITVETKETDAMKSGKATAKLTVNKADGKCTISISDVDYGSKPNPTASSTTNPGEPEYLYKRITDADTAYSSEVPTESGEYKVKAVFTASDLYSECSAEEIFTIKPAESKEDTTKNGLYYEDDGCWYLYNNDVINEGYTGLYYDPRYDWWYVENGKINKSFSGLYNDSNCGWWLVENGRVDKTYSDLYYDPKYGWWKIEEGTIDFGYNDLYESETCGWWLIIQGQVSFGYDDLYCSPKYGWWKVKDGEVDFRYSDLYDSKTYGWWLVLEGRVALEYNDLYGSETCGWWLVSGGKVDFDFSDLYGSPNYGWWLVLNGRVAFEYCDLYGSPKLGWWKVDHGYVDFEYTGLYGSSAYGWWLIGQGQVAFNYNGSWEDQAYGEWDVAGGAVVF